MCGTPIKWQYSKIISISRFNLSRIQDVIVRLLDIISVHVLIWNSINYCRNNSKIKLKNRRNIGRINIPNTRPLTFLTWHMHFNKKKVAGLSWFYDPKHPLLMEFCSRHGNLIKSIYLTCSLLLLCHGVGDLRKSHYGSLAGWPYALSNKNGTYNRLNIMRKSRTFLDRYSLEKNYISFIRPLVEYAEMGESKSKLNK